MFRELKTGYSQLYEYYNEYAGHIQVYNIAAKQLLCEFKLFFGKIRKLIANSTASWYRNLPSYCLHTNLHGIGVVIGSSNISVIQFTCQI